MSAVPTFTSRWISCVCELDLAKDGVVLDFEEQIGKHASLAAYRSIRLAEVRVRVGLYPASSGFVALGIRSSPAAKFSDLLVSPFSAFKGTAKYNSEELSWSYTGGSGDWGSELKANNTEADCPVLTILAHGYPDCEVNTKGELVTTPVALIQVLVNVQVDGLAPSNGVPL